ncbi:hypothetical protein [Caballeronia sp. GAWG1-1]|uniref:hypothetical protein n=1 Tax=Caballeronia sp. GAWG1-1 TaxID=2921742 RepID=UPI0020277D4B|nr:hypothetical protein [Caballeronia sp. GAWG1-1]
MLPVNLSFVAHVQLGSGRLIDDPMIVAIARRRGKTNTHILLRWLVQQPGVAALPKWGDGQRIGENIEVFDFALHHDEKQRIAALASPDGCTNEVAWVPQWNAA